MVCVITMSPLASLMFKGLATKQVTVKWTIDKHNIREKHCGSDIK